MSGVAHDPLHNRSVPQGRTIDSVRLATITTDTGPLAPGNREFSRFSVPGMCLGAVGIAKDIANRPLDVQIAQLFEDTTLRGHALSESAMRIAKVCAARFTVATVTEHDLPDLLVLALMAGNDSLARAVINRQSASATDVEGRATVLQQAIDKYLSAEPARIAAAETTLSQLDALGTQAQGKRIDGHTSLLSYMLLKYKVPEMQREAGRIIALGHEVPVDSLQHQKADIFAAYQALSMIAYIEYPDSVMPIASMARRDIGRFGELPPGIRVPLQILLHDFSTMPVRMIRDALVPYNADRYAGKTLPPIQASYWFPKAPSSWPPGDGHASLIIYGGWLANDCAREDPMLIGWQATVTREECNALYTYLPHWGKLYGDRLAMTLVSQTREDAARSVELSPAQEADTLKWFFLDRLRLPVTFGLVVDSIWRLPPVDGRHFRIDTTFYGSLLNKPRLNGTSDLIVMLYDEHRTLRYVGSFDVIILRPLIDQMLGTKQTTPPPSNQP